MDVRGKLVELLDEAEEWADCKCDELGCESCPADKMKGDCVQQLMVDRLIAHGVTVQEWISVKDRLPDESGKYIVCCDDSGCPYGEGIWYRSGVVVIADVYVSIYGGICWEWAENGTVYDLEGVVTHWIPLHLPQPPKGE